MKQLTCEMCGSTDLVKKDGLFVCQSCGTKYSVEEAKKMMTGTVTIDKSSEKSNLKILAKRYYDNKEYEKSDDYYDRIIELDPNDWEAVYYGGLASAYRTTFDNVRLNEAFIGAENALQIMTEEERVQNLDLFKKDLKELILMHGNWIHGTYNQDFSETDLINFYSALYEVVVLADRYYTEFSVLNVQEGDEDWFMYHNIMIWSQALTQSHNYQWGYNTGSGSAVYKSFGASSHIRDTGRNLFNKYKQKMLEINPEFRFDVKEDTGGWCYIATSVYGSYDCPEVWTLRRFRDFSLAQNIFGRAFIKIYYVTSPTLVKYFGETKLFKKVFKTTLDKFVCKLQEKGYESTEYKD